LAKFMLPPRATILSQLKSNVSSWENYLMLTWDNWSAWLDLRMP
jgi:hypothetical protein